MKVETVSSEGEWMVKIIDFCCIRMSEEMLTGTSIIIKMHDEIDEAFLESPNHPLIKYCPFCGTEIEFKRL